MAIIIAKRSKMYYYLILIATIILLGALALAFSSTKKRQSYDLQMFKLNDEEIIRSIVPYARTLRKVHKGNGANLYSLLPAISKAERSIAQKVRSDKPIFEFERWFFENIYLIKRFVFSNKRYVLKNLPHCDGEVRIIKLARKIVSGSLLSLNAHRIEKLMLAAKNELTLTFSEAMHFEDAIGFALTEQIYILAKRILFHSKMQRVATKGYVDKKHICSDIYCHFALENEEIKQYVLQHMQIEGINIQSIPLNYNKSLLETTQMAESIFSSFMGLKGFVPKENALTFLNSDSILKKSQSYGEMNFETKLSYHKIIEKLSERLNISEVMAAGMLIEIAVKNSMDIGDILYDHYAELHKSLKTGKTPALKQKSRINNQRCFIGAIIATFFAFTAGIFFLSQSLLLTLLGAFPLFFAVDYLINSILSSAVRERILPRMNYQRIPPDCRTLVVVSEFITSSEQAEEAVRRLKALGESNKEENLEFSLLVDLKASESAVSYGDEEIKKVFNILKDVPNYNVFIRKRVKIGKKYSGYERKRGAIMALNRFLMSGNSKDFDMVLNDCQRPVYIVTLDADNTVLPGGFRDMVNIISHPYNQRYDLITAKSRYNLFSVKTLYGSCLLDESGLAGYPVYSSYFYNLFGRDIFCGKGIFRLKNFFNKLEGIFPSKKILSHDILEGAVLSTGCGSTIFEDAPKNFFADRDRKKRWIRGDIQLLPFVGRKWKNDENEIYKSEISCFYKYLMAKNAFSVLLPLFIFALAITGAFISLPALIYAGALVVFPYLINFIKILRGVGGQVRFRYLAKRLCKLVMNFVEEIFLIPYYAVGNLILFATTVFKMIAKKNLLEWRTYRQSQSSSAKFAVEFLPTFIVLALLSIAGLFSLLPFYVSLFCLLSCAMQLSRCIYSLPLRNKKVPEADIQLLREHAESTYRFFNAIDEPELLCCDNLQVKPYKGLSENTSPTNLGYAILADISAFYLGFIDSEGCIDKISLKLEKIKKLKKWHGHLYNWYNIRTMQTVKGFVSSVDSGNFVACLYVLKEFLAERGEEELKNQVTEMIDATDFTKLYNHSTSLFYLGYDEDSRDFTGHYDLLASEARLLSLIFIARYGKTEHWWKLQRDYSSLYGNTLLSWSGTTFEYLMSDIFFVPPVRSLLGMSSINASKAQYKTKFNGLWGVSESGHYDLDENFRYQYYAFGIRKLSLRNELDKPIVSPYSSFLALRWQWKNAMRNIRNLSSVGAQGDYGFYEAVDARGKIRIVSSYMTHHQGMALASIANALCKDKLSDLFTYSADIAGSLNILNELPSQGSYGRIKSQKPIKYNIITQGYYENVSKIEQYPSCASLTNGNIIVTADNIGNNFASFRSLGINPQKPYGEYSGGYFYVTENDKIYSPSFYPLKENIDDYVFSYSNIEITLENTAARLKENICVADGINMYVRKLKAASSAFKDPYVYFYMPLSLNTSDSYDSHPVFCKMFISSKYDAKEKCLIYKRTSLDKKGDLYFAVVIKGLTDLEIESNRFNFLGRNGSEKAPKFLFTAGSGLYPSIGDVLEPCVGFRGKFEDKERECSLVFLVAETEEELYSIIKFLPEDSYKFASESARSKLRVSALANKLSGELKYIPYPNSILNSVLDANLTENFLRYSSGLKTVLYRYSGDKGENFIRLVQAVKDLQFVNIKAKLVIVFEETFNCAVREHLESHLQSAFIRHYSLVEAKDFQDYMAEFAFIIMDSDLNYTPNKARGDLALELERQLTQPDIFTPYEITGFESGAGAFTGSAYELTEKPLLPYSNVVCGEYGGYVATENGGGFTYFGNSRENKALSFDFDPVADKPSEYVYLRSAVGCFRLNGGAEKWKKTVLSKGMTRYYANFNDYQTAVSYYILDGGKAKVSEISVNFTGGSASLFYGIEPCLGWRVENSFIAVDSENQIMKITNLITGSKLFARVLSGNAEQSLYLNEKIPYYEIMVAENTNIYAILSDDYEYIKGLKDTDVTRKRDDEITRFKEISNVTIETPVKSFDLLASCLPYQVLSSRINGKCGYYQVGGAVGFRDQLQDCLAFLQSKPEIVKRHIIDAALHQYEEGDVMHWWHHPKWGLRTKITDDKLYLPYVIALYVETTGDYGILDENYPYLVSPALGENQHTRYENPPYSDYEESIYQHCIKAIKSSLRFGEHKLLLLGGGDWNDGLDFAGSKGKGESVMLSMFCYETLNHFANICENETKSKLLAIAADLKNAVNATFDGRQYGRIYTDDEKWLGYPSSKEYQIDLTAQSYAVLSGIAHKSRQEIALESAYSLVDADNGLVRLLYPPLDKTNYLGYISSYPKGMRENGGQYTHAAVWYIIALAKIGKVEESFKLFQMINPVEKCIKNYPAYKAEPYVLAGDVYSNPDNPGRAGWSWYTGSAAWAYRLILEVYFGIKRKKDTLYISPSLPEELNGSQLIYKYKDSTYILNYEKGARNSLIIDGVRQSKNEIKLKEKNHVEITVEAGMSDGKIVDME